MERCLAVGAAFVLCPCCVGKVAAGSRRTSGTDLCSNCDTSDSEPESEWGTGLESALTSRSSQAAVSTCSGPGRNLRLHTPTAPRSQMYRGLLSADDYYCLARAADVPVNLRFGAHKGKDAKDELACAEVDGLDPESEGGGGSAADGNGEAASRNRSTAAKDVKGGRQLRKSRSPSLLQCRRMAKAFIEHDRACRAAEAGYVELGSSHVRWKTGWRT
eukprot:scaffold304_cov248-Pinguiococcus_pyrenoidosus.AAC.16